MFTPLYTAAITHPRHSPAPVDAAADRRPTLQIAHKALAAKKPAARGRKRFWRGNRVKENINVLSESSRQHGIYNSKPTPDVLLPDVVFTSWQQYRLCQGSFYRD